MCYVTMSVVYKIKDHLPQSVIKIKRNRKSTKNKINKNALIN